MKGDIRAFGARNSRTDSRDRVGKLTLTAENEGDAAVLALVSRHLFEMSCTAENGNRLALYRLLRDRVDDKETFPEA